VNGGESSQTCNASRNNEPFVVTVLTPHIGEFLHQNEQYKITWSGYDAIYSIYLIGSKAGSSGQYIGDTSLGQKEFIWTVPSFFSSSGYQIQLSSEIFGIKASSGSFSIVANGVCGSANGQTFSSAPTTNLCSVGVASTIEGNGPWTWVCGGIHGETVANCGAQKSGNAVLINGKCGSQSGAYNPPYVDDGALNIEFPNLCAAGIVSNFQKFDSGDGIAYWWVCQGSGGGSSSNWCESHIKLSGACGSANGSSTNTAPSSNLCATDYGNNPVSDTGSAFIWTCNGKWQGAATDCFAYKTSANLINGACGSANGQTFSSAPMDNLCSLGTTSAVTGNGPWIWTCVGQNGGTNASCSGVKVSTSSAGIYKIPVLIISYIPLDSSGRVNKELVGSSWWLSQEWDSLSVLRKTITDLNGGVISSLESGSKYHGYKNSSVTSSLDYEIVDIVEYLKPMPTVLGKLPGSWGADYDYKKIMEDINIKDWVENKGVKEVWIWGYHTSGTNLNESNMAGPYGNISNSYRLNDLPVLSKSYTVYHYNYTRELSCAIEDHVHQIEAVLGAVDENMFWNKFVGWYPNTSHKVDTQDRHAGWAHYPPNAITDYDWVNKNYALTDIADWNPEHNGQKQKINSDLWHGNSLEWFIYWMQNIPGYNNNIFYNEKPLTNWWVYMGDFDNAMKNKFGLVRAKENVDAINGQCGLADGKTLTESQLQIYVNNEVSQLCSSGSLSASYVFDAWHCGGINGGTTAACKANIINYQDETQPSTDFNNNNLKIGPLTIDKPLAEMSHNELLRVLLMLVQLLLVK
jgi:hypothetical protein